MKLTQMPSIKRKTGMTLLELTVVILVLLSLISILFIGARAWKKGSDRAGCILNIRNTQQAVRGYLNVHTDKVASDVTADILFSGTDAFLKQPICPGDSTKTYASSYTLTAANAAVDGDAGGSSVCLACKVSATDHKPDGDLTQW